MKNIVVIPGDGVGPEVTKITVDAINKLTKDIDFVQIDAGYDLYKKTGRSMQDDATDAIDRCDAVLLGAISEPLGKEKFFKNPIDEIVNRMDLYAKMTDVSSIIPGTKFRPDLDLLFVREYESHSSMNEVEDMNGITLSKRFSYIDCERTIKILRKYTEANKASKVTCVRNPSYFRETDDKFIKIYNEIMNGAPFVANEESADGIISDISKGNMKDNIIVCRNPLCDALISMASSFTGGQQLVPSIINGDKRALFMPIHGSDLRDAGMNTINPTASLLCGSWLLNFFGYEKEAFILCEAVRSAYKRGICTKDVGGNTGTKEFGEAVSKIIDETPLN